MQEDSTNFPYQAGGKIRGATHDQIGEARRRFGVTRGALVRMALEDFMPRYMAAEGRAEHLEFFGQISAVISQHPEIKPAIEEFVRAYLRAHPKPASPVAA